jgi:hypothetical protein
MASHARTHAHTTHHACQQEYYSTELDHAFCCSVKQCGVVAQLVHASVCKALSPAGMQLGAAAGSGDLHAGDGGAARQQRKQPAIIPSLL